MSFDIILSGQLAYQGKSLLINECLIKKTKVDQL